MASLARAGERLDPPAGERRARHLPGGRRAEQKAGHTFGLGSELQPAALGQGEPVDLGQRRDQAGAAQSLLQRPETGVPAPRPDHDQPRRIQAELQQPRPVQLVPGADPDHVAICRQPAEQHRCEARGRGMLRRAAQLVQGAAGQPAARQDPLDAGKRQS